MFRRFKVLAPWPSSDYTRGQSGTAHGKAGTCSMRLRPFGRPLLRFALLLAIAVLPASCALRVPQPESPLSTLPKPMTGREMTLWLAEAVRSETGADVVFLPEELVTRDLPAGPIFRAGLLESIPRQSIVLFSLDGPVRVRALLHKLQESQPDLFGYSRLVALDKTELRVAYPCVRYDMPLDLETSGLDDRSVQRLERLPDETLWRIAVRAARASKTIQSFPPTKAPGKAHVHGR